MQVRRGFPQDGMMRVLITSDCLLPRWDGVARFLSEVVPRLAGRFEVTVLGPDWGAYEIPGVKVVRIPLGRIAVADIRFAKWHWQTVRDLVRDADVVFNQTLGPIGMMSILCAKRAGVPIVSYNHNVEWELAIKSLARFQRVAGFLTKVVARWFYNKCRLLVVPGDDTALLMQSTGIVTPITVVPLGVDTKKFHPPEDKAAAKVAVGIDPALSVVGFVGRIAREKDLHTLQEAFFVLHKEHPDTLLLVVGEGLRGLLQKHHTLRITGATDTVERYLQAMDVFVLPSLTETSSLATMEAMSCALPVIVTPVGSIPDYVEHEKNGWFFGRRDVEDLVQKLRYLVEKPDVRANLGLGARQTMVQRYDWDSIVKDMAGAIESVALKNKAIEKRPAAKAAGLEAMDHASR